ncbi:hypothetical protein LPJCHP_LPJCHP_15960, partial [Dysosmobacter welbionis]
MHRVHGVDKGQAEILRQAPGNLLGDGIPVALQPGGVA